MRRGARDWFCSSKLVPAVILAAYLAAAATYSVMTPLLEGWDEVAHFVTLRHSCCGSMYPNPESPGLPSETGQPPLYYWIVGALTHPLMPATPWNPELNPSSLSAQGGRNFVLHSTAEEFPYQGIYAFLHAARGVTVLLGSLATLCVYLSGRLLAPKRRSFAIVAALLMSFDPTWLQVSSVIDNDCLPVVATAVAIYLWLRLATGRGRHAIWLGVAVGLGELGKATALFLLPVFGLLILWQALRMARGWPATRLVLEFALPAVGLAAWWWGRQSHITSAMQLVWGRTGPLMAFGAVVALAVVVLAARSASRLAQPAVGRGLLVATLIVAGVAVIFPLSALNAHLQSGLFVFRTFVASFATGVVEAPAWFYPLYGVLAGALIVGLFLDLWSKRSLAAPKGYLAGLALVVLGAGLLPLTRSMAVRDLLTLHGRFFLPALPPLSLLLAVPIASAGSAIRRFIAPSLGAAVAGLAMAIPFVSIAPAFAPAPVLSAPELAAAPHNANVDFGGLFRLVGYQVSPTTLLPGELVHVTLYWTDEAPTDQNWEVGVHLLDPVSFASYADANNHPDHGLRPTSTWRPGESLTDSYDLQLSPKAEPQTGLRLAVAMFRGSAGRLVSLPSHVGAGSAGTTALLGLLRVGGQPSPPTVPLAPLQATAGGLLRLVAVWPVSTSAAAGSTISVDLEWRALRAPSERYTEFVHLVSAQGQLLAQHDSQPKDGHFPTTLWQTGDPVFDHVQLAAPAGYHGAGTIQVGWYGTTTQQPLPFANKAISLIVGYFSSP